MPEPRITVEEVARLRNRGLSNRQIAEIAGLSPHTIENMAYQGGVAPPRRSHKRAIPWTVRREHAQATPRHYLTRLSTLSQGGQLGRTEKAHRDMAHTVIEWANRIIDANKDIDYDPTHPPNEDESLSFKSPGGFFLREADKGNWHLSRLMSDVRRGMIRRQSTPDKRN